MEFLSQQGVEFEAKNVQEDEAALKEMLALNSRSTPTITVGDEVMIGFDGDKLLALIKED